MERDDRPLARKHDYKKTGLGVEDARERRRQESDSLTRQSRELHLRSKRLKRAQNDAGSANLSAFADDSSLAFTLNIIKTGLAGPVDSSGHLEALVKLRQLISAAGEAAVSTEAYERWDRILAGVMHSGCVPILISDLMPKQDTGVHRQVCYEACWALSNIAASEHKHAEHVLHAGPVLIAHLSGGFGVALAEQSAWALGNLAGDSPEFRSRLLANGALLPLTRLTLQGRAWSSGSDVAAAAQTAAWALCNLIKDMGPEVREMVSVEGFKSGLRELLGRSDEPGLVTEAAWLTAHITAAAHKHLAPKEILPQLLALLPQCISQMPSGESSLPPGSLTPILRSIGNLLAAGQQQQLSAEDFSNEQQLQCLLACGESRRPSIQQEATWVLANLAGLPTATPGGGPLRRMGGDRLLARLLRDGTFPVRKEAAFGLVNLFANDVFMIPDFAGRCVADVPGGVLPAFASLARSTDEEAVLLALRLFEAVLVGISCGRDMIEAVGGTSILEQLQQRGSQEAQEEARRLLDQFFV